MTARRVVGGVGRALIGLGLILLLFVAYQLWGTGWHEARAQDRLRRSFEESLATTTTTAPRRPSSTTSTTTTTTPPLAPPEGEAVAMLRIPDIGLEKAVVEGVSVADLKNGPGHYPNTPMPGQPGNAAIAGHRTTYGQPFYRLDELEPGDEILVTTLQGEFRYEVTDSQIVKPSRIEVLEPTDDDRLTLTTCHPRYSARQRLIVTAALQDDPAPAPPPTTVPPGETPTVTTPSFDPAGLSGDRTAAWPVLFWGLLAAVVLAGTWLAGRMGTRWVAYPVGGLAFLVVLFIFFENVARLLPANI